MNRIHQKMSLEQKIQTLKEDFMDRVLPIGNRIDTFLGLTIHEGCHLFIKML